MPPRGPVINACFARARTVDRRRDMTVSVPDFIGRAARALGLGDHDGAVGLYEQAVALDPAQADAWYNLGWLHRSARRFDAALDAYAQAIVAGVARPEEVHLNRAAILSDHLFRPEEAIDALRQALAVAPGFVPAWLNLGTIAEDRGDADAAREAYSAALRLDPGNGHAQARLATLDTLAGNAAAASAALEAALPLAPTADDRADMLFALGGAFDAQERYDDAWQAYAAGNRFARSVAHAAYDPKAQEALVDRLIAAFPASARAVAPR